MSDTTPVRLTLPGDKPPLSVEILPRGLTIHRLIVRSDDNDNDIVIGPEKPEDHASQKYTNTIIGRYSNRIPAGVYILERKGIRSVLAAKPNENSKVSLHGGPTGFDAVVWKTLSKDEAPELFSSAEIEKMRSLPGDSYALFSLVSPHGDQGYPGELLTEVLVSLVPSSAGKLGSVVIVYRCRLNGREKVVTSVNLTQHWGFNLEASLSGGKQLEAASVKEHELMIGADYIANLDGYYLPTGEYTPVSIRPSHDFWEPSLIGKFPTSGYNDYFLFDDSLVYPSPRRAGLSDLQSLNLLDDILNHDDIGGPPSVRLESKKAGIALQFFSNQRGVMFYSNFLAEPNNGARKNIHGGSGVTGEGDSYSPWTAAFLEFHEPLAAFLRPENRDGEDTLLASGELYNNFVRLEIEQIARP